MRIWGYKMVKFSVCIPVYNDSSYVKVAIDSVLNQTIQDFEIIVSDDCSTDDTIKVLESYGDKIKLVKNTENRGIGANRNVCIDNSTGDYISFLSSDDYYQPNYLEEISKSLKEDSFICTAYNVVDEDGIKVGEFQVPEVYEQEVLRVFAWSAAKRDTMFCNYSTIIASRDMWLKYKFDESYIRCEDLEHLLRFMVVDKINLITVNKFLLNYRVFPNMGTNKIRPEIPVINAKTIVKIRVMLECKQ